MKKNVPLIIVSFILALVLGFNINTPARAQFTNTDSRMGFFYTSLKPYGDWIYNNTYGWCWYPYNISVDWRPYTDGQWVYTDDGWTFSSDVPWAWACYHYGRWFYDEDHGWLWFPDTVWAPCWVAWRYGNDCVGWAPLPPSCTWSAETGIQYGTFDPDDFPFFQYSFCRARDFGEKDLRSHCFNPARNGAWMKRTKFIRETIKFSDNRVIGELPFHDNLVTAAGHEIKRIRITRVESPVASGISGNEFRAFHPEAVYKNGIVPLYTGTKPKELEERHNGETKALEMIHKNRQTSLMQEHATEKQNPPAGVNLEQLNESHKVEINAHTQIIEREQHLLQNQHAIETHIAVAPMAPPQRHYIVNMPQQGKSVTQPKDNSDEGNGFGGGGGYGVGGRKR